YLSVLDILEEFVLLLVGQIGKKLALIGRPAISIKRGQRLAIGCRRPVRGLRPLLLGAGHEGRPGVMALGAAVGSGQLAVDEDGAAGILPAGRLPIRSP